MHTAQGAQGRESGCAVNATNPDNHYRVMKPGTPVAVDPERERAEQEAWLQLVRRSGAGAGGDAQASDADAPEPVEPDWGVVALGVAAVLLFVICMAMLYMGVPLLLVAVPVLVAVGLELICEVLTT